MKFIRPFLWSVLAGVLASPSGAWACSACFGKSDATMAKSVNAGIFSLMGVIVTVLAGAASFFVFLSRRAASVASAENTGQPSK